MPARTLLGIALVAAVAIAGTIVQFQSGAQTGDLIRPFAANSPLNVPIPANVRVDPKSAEYVRRLESGNLVANSGDYSNAIYDNVTASTPRLPVHVTNDSRNGGNWGHNHLYGLSIPVPAEAVPPPGTDGTVIIVDRAGGWAYYLWQFRRESNRVVTTWGARHALSGLGTTDDILAGRGTAAGVSQLGGTIRIEEVKKGAIDHALTFAMHSNLACRGKGIGESRAPNGEFRWPAQASDAAQDILSDPGCVPYGARVQLDPSLNFDDKVKYPSLTPVERMIAKAMQKYGAYLVDKGGASMAFSFETAEPGDPSWCQLGLAPAGSWACPTDQGSAQYWNFNFMKGNLRVLADCHCGTTRASTPLPQDGAAPPPAAEPPAAGSIRQTGNLLSGKAFTASSAAGADFGAAKVNDKDEHTRWISRPADPSVVFVDLGQAQTLGKVSILWAGDTTRNYEVQMSPDNQNWQTVASGTTGNVPRQLISHTAFTAAPTGRYLRVIGRDRHNAAYGHSIWEIGAYTGASPAKRGDLNGDGHVSITDLSILLSGWGAAGDPDLNGDGTVNISDLSILLSGWG